MHDLAPGAQKKPVLLVEDDEDIRTGAELWIERAWLDRIHLETVVP